MGRTWTLLPYLMSEQAVMETTSPNRSLKLFRTTRFIRILSSDTVSSERTMQTVSFRFFPLSKTESPRNNSNWSILDWESATTELSSLAASSTINRLGRSFFFKMAVANSSPLFFGGKYALKIAHKQIHFITEKIILF